MLDTVWPTYEYPAFREALPEACQVKNIRARPVEPRVGLAKSPLLTWQSAKRNPGRLRFSPSRKVLAPTIQSLWNTGYRKPQNRSYLEGLGLLPSVSDTTPKHASLSELWQTYQTFCQEIGIISFVALWVKELTNLPQTCRTHYRSGFR